MYNNRLTDFRARNREIIWPASQFFFAGQINFSLTFLFFNCQNGEVWCLVELVSFCFSLIMAVRPRCCLIAWDQLGPGIPLNVSTRLQPFRNSNRKIDLIIIDLMTLLLFIYY